VTEVSIEFRKERKVNQKIGISIQNNTNNTYEDGDRCVRVCSARNTGRTTGREGNIHTTQTHRNRQV